MESDTTTENKECASRDDEETDVVDVLTWGHSDVLVDGTPEFNGGRICVDPMDVLGDVLGV